MTLLWTYVWKSSDGSRHEATIEAPTKERAFELLREKGIKAVKVTQVLRKRDRAILYCRRFGLIVIAALLAGGVSFYLGRMPSPASPPPVPRESDSSSAARVRPLPRRQIDLSCIDVNRVFAFEAERRLADFASPGIVPADTNALPADITRALATPLLMADDDTPRILELKGVVTGLKNEISLFRSGGRSLAEISEWLMVRQQMEASFRRQIIGGRGKDAKFRDAINTKLRSLGLAEIGGIAGTENFKNPPCQTNEENGKMLSKPKEDTVGAVSTAGSEGAKATN